jgi:hypothetical protein
MNIKPTICTLAAIMIALTAFAAQPPGSNSTNRKPGMPFQGEGPVKTYGLGICMSSGLNYELHERGTTLLSAHNPPEGTVKDRHSLLLLKQAADAYPKKVVHIEGTIERCVEGVLYVKVTRVTPVNHAAATILSDNCTSKCRKDGSECNRGQKGHAAPHRGWCGHTW